MAVMVGRGGVDQPSKSVKFGGLIYSKIGLTFANHYSWLTKHFGRPPQSSMKSR